MKSHAFFLILSLFACKAQKHTPPRDLIRVAIEEQPNSLDPRIAKGTSALQLLRLYTQGLVFLNQKMKPQGDLAESFVQKDSKTIIFRLRKDCFFHNGRAVNAEDVLFSLDSFTKNSPYPLRPGIKNIKNYQINSAGEIVISLNKADPFFLESDLSSIRILPKPESQQVGFADKPIGSGAFSIEQTLPDKIILKRHFSYKTIENGIAMKPIAFNTIEVRYIHDSTSRFLALKSHQIDVLINQLTLAYTNELQHSDSFRIYKSPGATYHYLLINFKNSLLQNREFRQQLDQNIPREALIDKIFYGHASIAKSPLPEFLVPKDFSFAHGISPLKKTIHHKNEPLEIAYEAGLENEAILMEIKKAWEPLGIQLKLNPLEKGILIDRVEKQHFDLALMKWSGISSASVLSRLLHSQEVSKGRNRGSFKNPQMDQFLDKNNLKDALLLFQKELPHFPLWFPDNIAVTDKSIVDFEWYPTGAWASFLHSRRVE